MASNVFLEAIREYVEEAFDEQFNLHFEFTGLLGWEENATMSPHYDR